MKKILYFFLFIFCMTLEMLSQENTDSLFYDIECFSKIVKYGLEERKWNLDTISAIKDSICINYLSSNGISTIGDTLFIIPNNYISENGSNFVGTKVVIDSDSSATTFLYIENSRTWLKGKSSRIMKKERCYNQNPITFKIIKKGSIYSIVF